MFSSLASFECNIEKRLEKPERKQGREVNLAFAELKKVSSFYGLNKVAPIVKRLVRHT